MSLFEEYVYQDSYCSSYDSNRYDKHTDRWADETRESVYGHSGHADVHTDTTY